ncbi:MAG: hypothetical protein ACRDP3_11620 [Streptomyces sp.]|uniref:hypothetical protein n=1 Tax=Streptomyces sp. TaxID=1931 RepID=UPI003D6A9025
MSDAQHPRNAEKARGKARPSRRGTTRSSASATPDADRLRRRARFLRERKEAKELRERVQPRRAHSARLRQAMRMRTFRW